MKKIMDTRIKAINKSNDSFKRFCDDIKRYDVMTPEEEKAVFDKYINGTPDEKDKVRTQIILSNQRFVLSVAKKYSTDTEEILCLVSEGNIGLEKAIDKFNPERGFKFCSFAVNWINQTINLYLDYVKNSMYRSNEIKIGRRADKIRDEFLMANGRYPSTDEIKDILMEKYNVKVEDDRDLLDCRVSSFDDTFNDDSDDTVIESGTLAARVGSVNDYEHTIEQDDMKARVKTLLSCLNANAQTVIRMAYGIDCEQAFDSEIAMKVGLCETRISQIKREAIQKMTKYAEQLAM